MSAMDRFGKCSPTEPARFGNEFRFARAEMAVVLIEEAHRPKLPYSAVALLYFAVSLFSFAQAPQDLISS